MSLRRECKEERREEGIKKEEKEKKKERSNSLVHFNGNCYVYNLIDIRQKDTEICVLMMCFEETYPVCISFEI
jgi:hypothetical protein